MSFRPPWNNPYGITNIYPRNRTLNKVVSEHLIPWAARSMYKTLNQAILPHIIIAINEVDISRIQRDTVESTKVYLDTLDTSFENDTDLLTMVDKLLENTASDIHTIKDLLQHFYASVTVIEIPLKGYYMSMDSQVTELYGIIKARCLESQQKKEAARVLLKAEKLERVLASIFCHFSQEDESPFDFLDEALWQNSIPDTFGGNILQLALAFQRSVIDESLKQDGKQLFTKLVPIIASYIMLDAERNNLPGSLRAFH